MKARSSTQQVQLSYCHNRCTRFRPCGVTPRRPREHCLAGNSNALVVVTQLQPITVVFNVAEDNLSQVRSQILRRTALPVDAFDRSQMNKIAIGHLLTIDNQVDTTPAPFASALSSTIKISRSTPPIRQCPPTGDTLHNTLLIPSAAVQRNGVQAFVYKVNSNHTASTQNIVEQTTDGNMSAVQGLNPGDTVSITVL